MYLKILWAAKIVHFLMVEKVSFSENDDKSLFNFYRLSLSAFMDRFFCSFVFYLSFFFGSGEEGSWVREYLREKIAELKNGFLCYW